MCGCIRLSTCAAAGGMRKEEEGKEEEREGGRERGAILSLLLLLLLLLRSCERGGLDTRRLRRECRYLTVWYLTREWGRLSRLGKHPAASSLPPSLPLPSPRSTLAAIGPELRSRGAGTGGSLESTVSNPHPAPCRRGREGVAKSSRHQHHQPYVRRTLPCSTVSTHGS